jgi:hypothetical protein
MLMQMKTKFLFLSLFLLTALQFTKAQERQSVLDEKKYKIELIRDGKTESVDTMEFNNSMLQIRGFENLGFKEGNAFINKPKIILPGVLH